MSIVEEVEKMWNEKINTDLVVAKVKLPKEPEPKIETKEEPVVASTGDFDLEEGT